MLAQQDMSALNSLTSRIITVKKFEKICETELSVPHEPEVLHTVHFMNFIRNHYSVYCRVKIDGVSGDSAPPHPPLEQWSTSLEKCQNGIGVGFEQFTAK